jgi:hypothetical protein
MLEALLRQRFHTLATIRFDGFWGEFVVTSGYFHSNTNL